MPPSTSTPVRKPLARMSSSQMEELHGRKAAELGSRLVRSVPPDATLQMVANIGTGNEIGLGQVQAMDTLLTNGDDCLDAFQGLYWTLKNRFLFEKPLLVDAKIRCPIVACGSGPSLGPSLETLRANQERMFIVAGESTTRVLAQNGIRADMVCPVERIDTRDYCMRDVEDTACYGGLMLVPRVAHRMDRHLAIVGPMQYGEWLGLDPRDYQTNCPLSGAQAVCNATYLAHATQAPVYLVGHDLCFVNDAGHVEGYDTFEFHTPDGEKQAAVLCNDGEMRPTTPEWLRVVGMLSQVVKRRANVRNCSPHGANFGFIESVELPTRWETCDTEMETGRLPTVDTEALTASQKCVGDDAKRLIDRIDKITSSDQLDLGGLLGDDNRNWRFFEVLLRPLFLQLSIMRKFGYDRAVVRWAKEGSRNVLQALMPLICELQEEA